MKKALIGALLLTSTPALAEEGLRYDPWPHAAVSTGIGLLVAADLAVRPQLVPESCHFCGGNAFDRSITESLAWERYPLAATFSDVGLGLLPLSALALGWAEDGLEEGTIDAIVFLEAFGLNFLATEAIKFAVARERPLKVYLPATSEWVLDRRQEWYVSFPSGHASSSFVSVAAAATIADLRGRNPAPIWLVGLPAATAVAYLRVAAYYHWTTDVLAGAALGTAIGVAVPRLLHGRDGLGRSEPASDRQAVQIVRIGGAF